MRIQPAFGTQFLFKGDPSAYQPDLRKRLAELLESEGVPTLVRNARRNHPAGVITLTHNSPDAPSVETIRAQVLQRQKSNKRRYNTPCDNASRMRGEVRAMSRFAEIIAKELPQSNLASDVLAWANKLKQAYLDVIVIDLKADARAAKKQGRKTADTLAEQA